MHLLFVLENFDINAAVIILLTPKRSRFLLYDPSSPLIKKRLILPPQLLPPSADFLSKECPLPSLNETLESGKWTRRPDYRDGT